MSGIELILAILHELDRRVSALESGDEEDTTKRLIAALEDRVKSGARL